MSSELPSVPGPSPNLPGPATGPPPLIGGYAGGAPDLGEQGNKGLDFGRFLSAVVRFKWLVALCTVLGLAAGVVMSRFSSPVYIANASLWIESGGGGSQSPIQQSQLTQSQGWVELLKSFVVLDPAVRELKLYLRYPTPEDSTLFGSFELAEESSVPGAYRLTVDQEGRTVTLATAEGIQVEQAAVGDSLGKRVGFKWVPSPTALRRGMEVDFSVSTPRDAARQLGEQLRAFMSGAGGNSQTENFLRVQLLGTNPRLLARTVNEVIERFVDVAAQLKREKLAASAEILREQLDRAERNLREAERELEGFRVRTITLPTEQEGPVAPGLAETRGPVIDRYFSLKLEEDQLTRDLAAIRRVLDQVPDSGLSVHSLEVIGAIQRSSEVSSALAELTRKQIDLRAELYRYTEEHPVVQRLASEVRELERVTIPSLLRTVMSQLQSQANLLGSRIDDASVELEQIPPRVIQEARLKRDVSVADRLYALVSERYETSRLAEASSLPDLSILDRAVTPQRPVSNQRSRLILGGGAIGLALAVLGVFLLDRLDRRVRYPDQITADLGLTLLGVVPQLKGARNGKGGRTAPVVEALRGIRLNVVHAYGAAGPLVMTVTSPGAGDGKSFVASNLALAFADAGHRTLLIDGDVRRGTLHRVLGAARKPGLTDVLAGNVAQADVVQETSFNSLYFLGCGTRTPEAPELLGSVEMSRLMASLRTAFSVIIVDSPPLGAGVDAFALGTVTGNLLMVLRLGITDRELAEAKLDVLDRLPVRVLGGVLNDVRPGPAYRQYRYHSYYLPGYEHDDESGRGETAALVGEKQ